ncbi:protein hit [Rhizocola hellebori]|uniref:Protein hit n=1 Tax=Rhizocola hellebori TaxID=1392758 RepID=A0A8J3QA77_9ACTN|nr:protein hit [Rhizocola hellebori]
MDEDNECQFCAIGRGTGSAKIVWSDEHSVAFLPLNPAAKGHTLVVPKAHVKDIWSLDDQLAARLAHSVLTVARGVREALQPDGLNVINSAGKAASQTVWHLHMHVVPRWHDDAIGNIWPENPADKGESEDVVAHLVRAALSGSS